MQGEKGGIERDARGFLAYAFPSRYKTTVENNFLENKQNIEEKIKGYFLYFEPFP